MKKPTTYAVFDLETIQDLEILDTTFLTEKFAPHIAHEVVALSMATFTREPFPNDNIVEIKVSDLLKAVKQKCLILLLNI